MSRCSSSRARSACANGSSVNSASGGPRHSPSASRSLAAASPGAARSAWVPWWVSHSIAGQVELVGVEFQQVAGLAADNDESGWAFRRAPRASACAGVRCRPARRSWRCRAAPDPTGHQRGSRWRPPGWRAGPAWPAQLAAWSPPREAAGPQPRLLAGLRSEPPCQAPHAGTPPGPACANLAGRSRRFSRRSRVLQRSPAAWSRRSP